MTLRLGVIGAGHMGSLHAEKVNALVDEGEAVKLAGVCDLDRGRAEKLASRFGCQATYEPDTLLSMADAVIVAVPTLAHFDVVSDALEAGLDVLVEKPIAATVPEAERLLAAAERGGRILQVGHLEWFNAAMGVIHDHIRRPRFIEAHRMGPFPSRATDIDVIRDLMIHDLDILQQVLGEEPSRIEAVGVPVLTNSIDIANARITYPSGCVANLTVSRVSPTPIRKIRFFQRDGYFSIDFLEQSAIVGRREIGGDGEPSIEIEKLDVDRGDALLAQLRAFLQAVRTRERPAVDGVGGLGALRTALRVNAAIPPIEELDG